MLLSITKQTQQELEEIKNTIFSTTPLLSQTKMQIQLIVATLAVIAATTTALPVRPTPSTPPSGDSISADDTLWLSLTASLYNMQRLLMNETNLNLPCDISVSILIILAAKGVGGTSLL